MNLPASLPRVWVCPVLSNHFTPLPPPIPKFRPPSQPLPRHPLLALPPQTALRVAFASAAGLPCQLVVAPGISGGSFVGWAIGVSRCLNVVENAGSCIHSISSVPRSRLLGYRSARPCSQRLWPRISHMFFAQLSCGLKRGGGSGESIAIIGEVTWMIGTSCLSSAHSLFTLCSQSDYPFDSTDTATPHMIDFLMHERRLQQFRSATLAFDTGLFGQATGPQDRTVRRPSLPRRLVLASAPCLSLPCPGFKRRGHALHRQRCGKVVHVSTHLADVGTISAGTPRSAEHKDRLRCH